MALQRYCYDCGTSDRWCADCPKKLPSKVAAPQRYCYDCGTSDHWCADCPKKLPSKVAAPPVLKVAEQPEVAAQPIKPVAEQSSKYTRQDRWKARNKDKVRAYHREYMRERRAANRPENFIIAKAE